MASVKFENRIRGLLPLASGAGLENNLKENGRNYYIRIDGVVLNSGWLAEPSIGQGQKNALAIGKGGKDVDWFVFIVEALMILNSHRASYDRLRPYLQEPMLMLGNQENVCKYEFGISYTTLDPDGGDYSWDLNQEIPKEWEEKCSTVYNLGTLEHVWDTNHAFKNVANVVRVGGCYLHSGPCAGYENHGIHVLAWKETMNFFTLNGFIILDSWFTEQNGTICTAPVRNCGRSILFWFAARKISTILDFVLPQQVFVRGAKQ